MALFPEVNAYYKGRTHTELVISEGAAPAERWIPSASETVKFQYAYGPEGNQNVVIPKGKIVASAGLEWDAEAGRKVPAIKIAKATDIPIGVNHHNLYERRRDRFSGNYGTVITREYIEVPLFTNAADAAAIKFGAATVEENDLDTCMGRFVKSDDHGNFILADNYDGLVVGQLLAIETDLPPAGYLQYFLEMTDNEYTDFLKQMSYAPTPGKSPSQGFYDSGTYPLGTSYLEPANRIRNWNKGIPRLTDGYFRARTNVAGITLDNIKPSTMSATSGTALTTGTAWAAADAAYQQVVSYKATGKVTVTNGVVAVEAETDGHVQGAALFIKLKDKLVLDALKSGDTNDYPEFAGDNPSDIKVYLRTVDTTSTPNKFVDTQVSPNNIHIDYTNNMIVVYFTSAVTAAKVLIDASLLIDSTPGIPTGWDFKGAIGAARILLLR